MLSLALGAALATVPVPSPAPLGAVLPTGCTVAPATSNAPHTVDAFVQSTDGNVLLLSAAADVVLAAFNYDESGVSPQGLESTVYICSRF